MRMRAFAFRNLRELIRDPMMLVFFLGFPVILLVLLSVIQRNIPVELFVLSKLTPGMAVFGLSFLSLFAGTLVARDCGSSFLMRLLTTPMTATDFMGGYLLPLVPAAAGQCAVCFLTAILLGLAPCLNMLLCLPVLLPVAVFFTAAGLLLGTVCSEKAVSGAASLLVNVAAWLSGIWFDLSLIGGVFEQICRFLPFAAAVQAAQLVLSGDWAGALEPFLLTLLWSGLLLGVTVWLFHRRVSAPA